jgi:subtilisin family serine protease
MKLSYKSYYVQNCIIVDNATPDEIYILGEEKVIDKVLSNNAFNVKLEESNEKIEYSTPGEAVATEWNVQWVKADKVWAKGFDGKGFTIANADTGVDYKHDALLPNYRGNIDGKLDHNYHWVTNITN